jgi:gamma-glutamylcyclotransferase
MGGDGVTLYFAFGSNLWSPRLRRNCPSAVALGIGCLSGYRMCFNKRSTKDGSGKGNVVATGDPVDAVHGAVYRILAADQARLDAAEFGYDPRLVTVQTAGGDLAAYTYVARADHTAEGLAPFDWYKAYVVEGAREHRLPEDYIRAIQTVPAVPDEDPQRQQEHALILARAGGARR